MISDGELDNLIWASMQDNIMTYKWSDVMWALKEKERRKNRMKSLQDVINKECAVKVAGIGETLLAMHKAENSITCLGGGATPTLYCIPLFKIEKVYDIRLNLVWERDTDIHR